MRTRNNPKDEAIIKQVLPQVNVDITTNKSDNRSEMTPNSSSSRSTTSRLHVPQGILVAVVYWSPMEKVLYLHHVQCPGHG